MSIKSFLLSLLFLLSTNIIAAEPPVVCDEHLEDNFLYVECTSEAWGVWELFNFDGISISKIGGYTYSNSLGAIYDTNTFVPVSLLVTYSNSSGLYVNYRYDIKLEYSYIGDFI